MSSNNQNPIVPGTVRALTNKWQAGGQSNPQQANLSLLDALPDRNCSLAVAINRWENRTAPTPAQQALQLLKALPDRESALISQSSQSNVVVRAPRRSTSFAFSSLPPEIRLMIWNFVMSEPQTIRITDNAMRHNRAHSRQNPAILYVNYESRTEALKQLKRLFGGVNGNGYPAQFKYFNPSLDSIYFDGGATRLFVFPPTILPPVADLTHEAPLAQADNVVSIQVDEDQMDQAGPAAYFRNLECYGIQYNSSRLPGIMFGPPYPTNNAGRQLFVRDIHREMALDTSMARGWFQTRLTAGLISRVPRIEILLTRTDQRIVDSTGQYAIDYFRDNPM
ncbi:uncharacterized protein EAF02_011884 [Botrytis sinoallii]|uniref:uncharacterized protein n=1 Tax=Botrytis sinoallii TaxID=1463999 RepID=UPI0018FF3D06|nr:uncharacterized protein EAF02_011884 [Botrytis sinoallii]KAF7853579.1 hypothetical protein EAF02_011884 [Botrytis sinoallii]